MTWVWSPEYKKVELPTTGYLAASSNRSDSDCVRSKHLAAALTARREAERIREGGHEVELEKPNVYERVAMEWNALPTWVQIVIVTSVITYTILGGLLAW
jgi:hypothetical protein